MAEHKEEKDEHKLEDEVADKKELHEDVVKAEAEPDDEKLEQHAAEPEQPAKKKFDIKALFADKKAKRILISVGLMVAVVAALFIIPTTRYGILGTFIKQTVKLTIMDSTAKHPVTEASVQLAGMTAKSDSSGKVSFSNVPVGPQAVKITKKYYKDFTGNVDVALTQNSESSLNIVATGRVVPVLVNNKLTGKGVEGVKLVFGESTAVTDYKGTADIVVPADLPTVNGSIEKDGYNYLEASLLVSDKFGDNMFDVVPAGKLYFLSKLTGKINVMKTDLDGGNRKVVLAGTGQESDSETVLLASRDWKYLALKSKRDGQPKLFLIDTTNKDLATVIDEGSANFEPLGWVDRHFTYKVTHTESGATTKSGYQTIKSFNAETKKISTLDSTQIKSVESGAFGEFYNSGPFLLANEIIFAKNWQLVTGGGGTTSGIKSGAYSIKADGTGKKTIINNVGVESYYSIVPYGPNEAYILQAGNVNLPTYEYEDGKLVPEQLTSEEVYGYNSTYLQSPSGKETFWSEQRDGLDALIIGDADGENDQLLGTYDDYYQYGWYTDDYLLVSKNSSELYIMTKEKEARITKVTDYHKPSYNYSFYGGGYGGL